MSHPKLPLIIQNDEAYLEKKGVARPLVYQYQLNSSGYMQAFGRDESLRDVTVSETSTQTRTSTHYWMITEEQRNKVMSIIALLSELGVPSLKIRRLRKHQKELGYNPNIDHLFKNEKDSQPINLSAAEKLKKHLVELSDLNRSILIIKNKAYVIYRGKADDEFEEKGFVGTSAKTRVKLVQDLTTGEFLALKILHTSNIDNYELSPSTDRAIENEVAILNECGQLHNYLQRIYNESIRSKYKRYMVMELFGGYSGGNLFNQIYNRTLIKQKKPNRIIHPLEMKLHIINAIISDLEKIHENGILHCDIKPDNIIWSPLENKASFVDWGLAINLNDDQKCAKYQPMNLSGTPGYVAPELGDAQTLIQELTPAFYERFNLIHSPIQIIENPYKEKSLRKVLETVPSQSKEKAIWDYYDKWLSYMHFEVFYPRLNSHFNADESKKIAQLLISALISTLNKDARTKESEYFGIIKKNYAKLKDNDENIIKIFGNLIKEHQLPGEIVEKLIEIIKKMPLIPPCDDASYSEKSDIYALGKTIGEILSSQDYQKLLSHQMVDLRSVNDIINPPPDTPHYLIEIYEYTKKLLDTNPDNRPSLSEIKEKFKTVLTHYEQNLPEINFKKSMKEKINKLEHLITVIPQRQGHAITPWAKSFKISVDKEKVNLAIRLKLILKDLSLDNTTPISGASLVTITLLINQLRVENIERFKYKERAIGYNLHELFEDIVEKLCARLKEMNVPVPNLSQPKITATKDRL